MVYIAPIFVAFVGVCVLIDGVAKRLGAGLCDQCPGDQGPGNRLMALGVGLIVAAVVIAVVTMINTARDGSGDRGDD